MTIISSSCGIWCLVTAMDEAKEDLEGLQTMRTLARIWLIILSASKWLKKMV